MSGACPACIARARLIAELGPALDRQAPHRERLVELLRLPDEELVASLGGSRRARLLEWRGRPETRRMPVPPGGAQLCRHAKTWPAPLRRRSAPALLTVLGGAGRLAELLARPGVVFLDSPEASDYGRAMAASLARGVTASGATVIAGLDGPLARSAHAGAAEAGGSVAVAGAGLDPARGGQPAELVLIRGCIVSELPWGHPGRFWSKVAAVRTAAGLAAATVLVESRAESPDLWAAKLARHLGAVPGMATNPLAQGPHALLRAGARLIGDARDILDLLHDAGSEALHPEAPAAAAALPPALLRVAELVGMGADTAQRLAAASATPREEWSTLAALGRLEISGILERTGQGRWVMRDPASNDGR